MSEGLVALKELRENGAVSFSRATISFTYLAFTKRADIIEKELKALEIIKRELDIIGLIEDGIKLNAIQLAQEEYDILKEVLLCH